MGDYVHATPSGCRQRLVRSQPSSVYHDVALLSAWGSQGTMAHRPRVSKPSDCKRRQQSPPPRRPSPIGHRWGAEGSGCWCCCAQTGSSRVRNHHSPRCCSHCRSDCVHSWVSVVEGRSPRHVAQPAAARWRCPAPAGTGERGRACRPEETADRSCRWEGRAGHCRHGLTGCTGAGQATGWPVGETVQTCPPSGRVRSAGRGAARLASWCEIRHAFALDPRWRSGWTTWT